MKNCLQCGLDHPDDAARCRACGLATFVSSSPDATGGYNISHTEQLYWEHMTFRQFAVLFIRIEALWFIFHGVSGLTYLVSRLTRSQESDFLPLAVSAFDLYTLLAALRPLLFFAAAAICLKYPERMVSWLTKDLIVTSRL
jgi:hypothetical protein